MKKTIFSLALLVASSPSWAAESSMVEIECSITPIDRAKVHPSGDAILQSSPTQHSWSTNWCGYAAAVDLSAGPSADHTVSNVAGSWTVPKLLATPNTAHCSIWVGIDGFANGSVEQIGTAHDWQNGAQQNFAWFEMYPQGAYAISNFPVDIGDVISGQVAFEGNGVFKLTLMNHTKKVSSTIPTSYTTSTGAMRTSAEWIVEAPYYNGISPLSDFQKVTMDSCSATIKGVTGVINNNAWKNDAITLAKNETEATPSALMDNGSAFQVTWKAE